MKTHTPAHTHSIPLRGLQFPYTFELTANNLLFPLTKEAWGKDNRAFDDLGISALLDLDGKFSSANENDLLGFGISKREHVKAVAGLGAEAAVIGSAIINVIDRAPAEEREERVREYVEVVTGRREATI